MKPLFSSKPFYFVRHGESAWNVLGQFAGGTTDCPLTEKGIQQAYLAKKIASNLNNKPDIIIHSHLKRASNTAKIINEALNLPMINERELREIDAGDWVGIKNIAAIKQWENGLTPQNGENLKEFSERIYSILNLILSSKDTKLPMIVAHGRIINALDNVLNIPPRTLQVQNCEILYFQPHNDKKRFYPWDVTIHTDEKNALSSKKATWSQI